MDEFRFCNCRLHLQVLQEDASGEGLEQRASVDPKLASTVGTPAVDVRGSGVAHQNAAELQPLRDLHGLHVSRQA